MPIVLIIAGSGPTDRDGNSGALPGKNNAYRMLANALAADGIASLRYDKRGIGESRTAGIREANLRFDMYVDDAVAWVSQLHGDTRFSRVIIAGHSEGSLIGMVAANKAHADAFVSVAGVAHRSSEVLRDQLRPQIGAMPELWQGSETILTALEAGTVVWRRRTPGTQDGRASHKEASHESEGTGGDPRPTRSRADALPRSCAGRSCSRPSRA
jgi:pimeloyl-ACP methyl ester carboxylesterase